jgi:hypothetical protein
MNQSGQNSAPGKMSDALQSAIVKSLEAEKVSPYKRMFKVVLTASLVLVVLACLLGFFFQESFSPAWGIACLFSWALLLIGFYLYFYPQPRIAVRGFWSKWVIAKVLVAMTVISALELIICPHFAFVHMDTPGLGLFEGITSQYMAVGGMAGCMFLCGLTFSGIAALFSFLFISKTLSGSNLKAFLPIAGIALIAQLPIMILQLSEHHLRAYFIFWLIGSAAGILIVAFLIQRVTGLISNRSHAH